MSRPKNYKVALHIPPNRYMVQHIKFTQDRNDQAYDTYRNYHYEDVFEGTLPECLAYIELKERGYLR